MLDGTGNEVIPVAADSGGEPVIYDPGADLGVASGLDYPTASRQTITLLFTAPLPVGSYEISLSPNIQTASFNSDEANSLVGDSSFEGHPMTTVTDGSVVGIGQISFRASNLVSPDGTPNPNAIAAGTPFLTQLPANLGALVDNMLTANGDVPAISAAVNAQIAAEFAAAYGPTSFGNQATAIPTFAIIWLDPVSLDLQAPSRAQRVQYNTQQNTVSNNLGQTYVEVGGNVEVIVLAGVSGTFNLNVGDVPLTARGGAVLLNSLGGELFTFTDALRSGTTDFLLNLGDAATVLASSLSTSTTTTLASSTASNAAAEAEAQNALTLLTTSALIGLTFQIEESEGSELAGEGSSGASGSSSSPTNSTIAAVGGAGDDESEDDNPKKDDDKKGDPKREKPKVEGAGDQTNATPMFSDDPDDILSQAQDAVDQLFARWQGSRDVLPDVLAFGTGVARGREQEEAQRTTEPLEPKHADDVRLDPAALAADSGEPTADHREKDKPAEVIAVSELPLDGFGVGEERLLREPNILESLAGDQPSRETDAYWLALFMVTGTYGMNLRSNPQSRTSSRRKPLHLRNG